MRFSDVYPELTDDELVARYEQHGLVAATQLTVPNLFALCRLSSRANDELLSLVNSDDLAKSEALTSVLHTQGIAGKTIDALCRRRPRYIRRDLGELWFINWPLPSYGKSWISMPYVVGLMVDATPASDGILIAEIGYGVGFHGTVLLEKLSDFSNVNLVGIEPDSEALSNAPETNPYRIETFTGTIQDYLDGEAKPIGVMYATCALSEVEISSIFQRAKSLDSLLAPVSRRNKGSHMSGLLSDIEKISRDGRETVLQDVAFIASNDSGFSDQNRQLSPGLSWLIQEFSH